MNVVPTKTRTIIDADTGEVIDPRSLPPGGGQLSVMSTQQEGALSTIAAEINQQVATARRFPRPRDVELQNKIMDRSTLTEDTANECMYSLPRGNKPIEGPSARFAEIVQQVWGNNRVSGEISHIDRENGRIFAEGIYLDLETNSATRIVISRRIASKDKNTGKDRLFSEDMIQVTDTAVLSIATRNAILKGVPKAVWRAGYEAVRKVVMGDLKTLSQRRAAAITEFQRFGITAGQLFGILEVKDVNDITLDHLLTLRGTLAALKNGETTVEEILAGAGKVDVPSAPGATSGGTGTSTSQAGAGGVISDPNTSAQGGGTSKAAATPEQQAEYWTDTKCIEYVSNALKDMKALKTPEEVDSYFEKVNTDGLPRSVVDGMQNGAESRKTAIADAATRAAAKEAAKRQAADADATKAAQAAATEKAASEATGKAAQDNVAGEKRTGEAQTRTAPRFEPGRTVIDKADQTKIEMKVAKVEDGFITCNWQEDGNDISATFKESELIIVAGKVAETAAELPPRKSVEQLSAEMRLCKSKKQLAEYYAANITPHEKAFEGEDLKELLFIRDRRMKLLVAE